jgi:hypothetical protein
MLFADNREAAQTAWSKHVADFPDEHCGLIGPGVYWDGDRQHPIPVPEPRST